MQPTPPGWPRLSTALFSRDPRTYIDWLVRALGFELRLLVPGDDGQGVRHSELVFGEAVVMVSGEAFGAARRFGVDQRSPRSAGANTQSVMLYVDDCDALCERARAAGARLVAEPALHDYGPEHWADRSAGLVDPEGHLWWISQRVRTGGG